MATGGIVDHDETSDRYYLPPEHAAMFTTPTGLGPIAATNTALAKHVPRSCSHSVRAAACLMRRSPPDSPTHGKLWARRLRHHAAGRLLAARAGSGGHGAATPETVPDSGEAHPAAMQSVKITAAKTEPSSYPSDA